MRFAALAQLTAIRRVAIAGVRFAASFLPVHVSELGFVVSLFLRAAADLRVSFVLSPWRFFAVTTGSALRRPHSRWPPCNATRYDGVRDRVYEQMRCYYPLFSATTKLTVR